MDKMIRIDAKDFPLAVEAATMARALKKAEAFRKAEASSKAEGAAFRAWTLATSARRIQGRMISNADERRKAISIPWRY